MNAADAAVSGHAVDTLINYESVKYFGNEDHEADRGVAREASALPRREAPLERAGRESEWVRVSCDGGSREPLET